MHACCASYQVTKVELILRLDGLENDPAPHTAHADAPALVENRPPSHNLQIKEPSELEYVPSPQKAHPEKMDTYSPGLHIVHVEAPWTVCHDPAGQRVHMVEPSSE